MEKGKIYISGVIGFCGKDLVGVMLIDVIAQVAAQPNATEFDVYINSDGGNVKEGFRIYKYLEQLGRPVNTYGHGRVASVATVIFMAGVNRFLTSDCEFMIHLPSGAVQGTAEKIQEYHAYIKEIEDFCVKFYSEKLGLDKDTVFALLQEETWLTSKDAIALKIAQPYIEETPIVAMADFSNKNKNYL